MLLALELCGAIRKEQLISRNLMLTTQIFTNKIHSRPETSTSKGKSQIDHREYLIKDKSE